MWVGSTKKGELLPSFTSPTLDEPCTDLSLGIGCVPAEPTLRFSQHHHSATSYAANQSQQAHHLKDLAHAFKENPQEVWRWCLQKKNSSTVCVADDLPLGARFCAILVTSLLVEHQKYWLSSTSQELAIALHRTS